MITPLGQGRPRNGMWFQTMLLYTLSGGISAYVIGWLLGAVGALTLCRFVSLGLLWGTFSVFCAVLAFRDAGIVSFPMPEVKRQAPQFWLIRFGYGSAVLMWGTYIGLGVATFITLSGFYALFLGALLSGRPGGGLIILGYWAGRVLPVWLAPIALPPRYQISRTSLPLRVLRASSTFALAQCVVLGIINTVAW